MLSVTGCVEGVRLTPPAHQDFKKLPKHAKWLKEPKDIDLTDPGEGVNATYLNT